MKMPLSAQDMIYDYDSHMYRLTYEYVKQITGVDLYLVLRDPYIVNKTQATNRVLMRLSQDIYSFIYSYNRDNNYQEYLISKSPIARENLKQALICQLEYMIRNGNIRMIVGINPDFSSINAKHELEDLRGKRSIDTVALSYLNRELENGEKLLYNGTYRYDNIKFREDY